MPITTNTSSTGLLIVISGPSGAGKGTIVKMLLDSSPSLHYSVSATTRAPREGEVNRVNYWFVDMDEFEGMIRDDELLEWAQVYGNYYGTPRRRVLEALTQGHDIILEIDPQGALQIQEKYPSAVFVYIMPPSPRELTRRISQRGTETPEAIQQRLSCVSEELSYLPKYDYLIVNEQVEEAVSNVAAVIRAEKCKVVRNLDLMKLVWNFDPAK